MLWFYSYQILAPLVADFPKPPPAEVFCFGEERAAILLFLGLPANSVAPLAIAIFCCLEIPEVVV